MQCVQESSFQHNGSLPEKGRYSCEHKDITPHTRRKHIRPSEGSIFLRAKEAGSSARARIAALPWRRSIPALIAHTVSAIINLFENTVIEQI